MTVRISHWAVVVIGASHNYVLLLPEFQEVLVFNLPSCAAYWNGRAKYETVHSSTREQLWNLTTILDEIAQLTAGGQRLSDSFATGR